MPPRRWKQEEYVSFVVRRDLTWGQRCSQIAHAAMEWGDDYDFEENTPVLVFGVDNLKALQHIIDSVVSDEVNVFHESDLGDEPTVIAFRGVMEGLRLL